MPCAALSDGLLIPWRGGTSGCAFSSGASGRVIRCSGRSRPAVGPRLPRMQPCPSELQKADRPVAGHSLCNPHVGQTWLIRLDLVSDRLQQEFAIRIPVLHAAVQREPESGGAGRDPSVGIQDGTQILNDRLDTLECPPCQGRVGQPVREFRGASRPEK